MIKVEIENDGIECDPDEMSHVWGCEGHYKIYLKFRKNKIYRANWLGLENKKVCLHDYTIKHIPKIMNNYNYIMRILFPNIIHRSLQDLIMSYHLADINICIKTYEPWEYPAILLILNYLQIFPKVLNNIIYQYSQYTIDFSNISGKGNEKITALAKTFNFFQVFSGSNMLTYN